MRDNVFRADIEPDVGLSVGVVDLALVAIRRIVARNAVGVALIKDAFLDRLVGASVAPDPKAIRELLSEMRRAVIMPECIAEAYIPAAARKLGQGWQDDTLSFSVVTLGTSRLATMLRQVEHSSVEDDIDSLARPAVLVIVPPGEQHTLGASVLASRLRRMGLAVSTQLSPSMSDLSTLFERRRFSGAMISVGNLHRLEASNMLIRTLRSMVKGTMPILVGGALLDVGHDVLFAREADLVTSDLDKALTFLGLDAARSDAGTAMPVAVGGRHQAR